MHASRTMQILKRLVQSEVFFAGSPTQSMFVLPIAATCHLPAVWDLGFCPEGGKADREDECKELLVAFGAGNYYYLFKTFLLAGGAIRASRFLLLKV